VAFASTGPDLRETEPYAGRNRPEGEELSNSDRDDPGIGFLRTLEGFGFVTRWHFPDNPLVGSRPVMSSRT
jgi:hypothetical protein